MAGGRAVAWMREWRLALYALVGGAAHYRRTSTRQACSRLLPISKNAEVTELGYYVCTDIIETEKGTPAWSNRE